MVSPFPSLPSRRVLCWSTIFGQTNEQLAKQTDRLTSCSRKRPQFWFDSAQSDRLTKQMQIEMVIEPGPFKFKLNVSLSLSSNIGHLKSRLCEVQIDGLILQQVAVRPVRFGPVWASLSLFSSRSLLIISSTFVIRDSKRRTDERTNETSLAISTQTSLGPCRDRSECSPSDNYPPDLNCMSSSFSVSTTTDSVPTHSTARSLLQNGHQLFITNQDATCILATEKGEGGRERQKKNFFGQLWPLNIYWIRHTTPSSLAGQPASHLGRKSKANKHILSAPSRNKVVFLIDLIEWSKVTDNNDHHDNNDNDEDDVQRF